MNLTFILLFSYFPITLFYLINNIYYYNNTIDQNSKIYNTISKITYLLANCNLTTIKRLKITNNIEYMNYLNYLSCKCKGIGYWGGFCLKKEKYCIGGNQNHDINLSNELADIFKDKTVVDLGAGLGWYCPIISKKSKKCDQYDGSVNIEEVTNGKVKYLNLAESIKFSCNYDIVMSIEVAEHIPKEYEDVYINNLIKCSKGGLLITWSKIGQGGHYHVNNKNREDVIKLFNKRGMKYQYGITNRLKNVTKISYLKNNILYFTK